MPRCYLFETAITIDHEEDLMLVDTTVRGVASQLLRAGFTETTTPAAWPYRRFQGQADQLRFRRPKGQRTLRGVLRLRGEAPSMDVQAA